VELRKLSIKQVVEAVYHGEITARELTEKTLKNCSVLNKSLNIFTTIAGIDALKQAEAVDRKVANGELLPLAGVPVVVKDDICYKVLPTGLGSAAFKEFFSPYTATVLEKLVKAGAIIVGKTNLDDMSLGSTTAASPDGPTANPWDLEHTAGSAGAAAVATGVCMLAIESDSGGALRQGASHCGVIGLRPTSGRISRYGLNTFCSSFGQVGITAIAGENIINALEIASGFDERDAATVIYKDRSGGISDFMEVGDVKIGYPAAVFDCLDSGQRDIFDQVRERYASNGFELIEIDLGLLPEALRAYYIIALAETSSNHSRFDGIRFGLAEDAGDLEELYRKTRSRIFGREARRRSIFGTILLSKGNYDLYYRQALKVWSLVRREFAKALTECDLLMLPAVKAPPRLVTEETGFLQPWEDDLFCAPVSLSGLPSLCLPAGQINKLPIGLQLVGPPFSEELLVLTGDRANRGIKLFPNGML